jgi:hypothetical protein
MTTMVTDPRVTGENSSPRLAPVVRLAANPGVADPAGPRPRTGEFLDAATGRTVTKLVSSIGHYEDRCPGCQQGEAEHWDFNSRRKGQAGVISSRMIGIT